MQTRRERPETRPDSPERDAREEREDRLGDTRRESYEKAARRFARLLRQSPSELRGSLGEDRLATDRMSIASWEGLVGEAGAKTARSAARPSAGPTTGLFSAARGVVHSVQEARRRGERFTGDLRRGHAAGEALPERMNALVDTLAGDEGKDLSPLERLERAGDELDHRRTILAATSTAADLAKRSRRLLSAVHADESRLAAPDRAAAQAINVLTERIGYQPTDSIGTKEKTLASAWHATAAEEPHYRFLDRTASEIEKRRLDDCAPPAAGELRPALREQGRWSAEVLSTMNAHLRSIEERYYGAAVATGRSR